VQGVDSPLHQAAHRLAEDPTELHQFDLRPVLLVPAQPPLVINGLLVPQIQVI